MRTSVQFTLIAVLIFSVLLLSFKPFRQEAEMNKCLVKYRSEWSKYCMQCSDYSKSYRVYFRNECNEDVDVKVAAQESDKRWRSFSRLTMHPGDSIVAYACKGTGKYLYWVRKPGDAQYVFPTDEEINQQYAQ